MIEASQWMIGEQQSNNPAVNKYFKLQIKTLQNDPKEQISWNGFWKQRERKSSKRQHKLFTIVSLCKKYSWRTLGTYLGCKIRKVHWCSHTILRFTIDGLINWSRWLEKTSQRELTSILLFSSAKRPKSSYLFLLPWLLFLKTSLDSIYRLGSNAKERVERVGFELQ